MLAYDKIHTKEMQRMRMVGIDFQRRAVNFLRRVGVAGLMLLNRFGKKGDDAVVSGGIETPLIRRLRRRRLRRGGV